MEIHESCVMDELFREKAIKCGQHQDNGWNKQDNRHTKYWHAPHQLCLHKEAARRSATAKYLQSEAGPGRK